MRKLLSLAVSIASPANCGQPGKTERKAPRLVHPQRRGAEPRGREEAARALSRLLRQQLACQFAEWGSKGRARLRALASRGLSVGFQDDVNWNLIVSMNFKLLGGRRRLRAILLLLTRCELCRPTVRGCLD
jgi:hypothetical protein